MVDQSVERMHNVDFLALVALIEGHLLAVGDQSCVYVTKFALIALLINRLDKGQ